MSKKDPTFGIFSVFCPHGVRREEKCNVNYYQKDDPRIMFRLSGDHLTKEMALTIYFLL